jgi:hypothetical protein
MNRVGGGVTEDWSNVITVMLVFYANHKKKKKKT